MKEFTLVNNQEINLEKPEDNFEQARTEFLDFINTPNIDFCRDNQLKEVSPAIVMKELKRRLLGVVLQDSGKRVIPFLKSLILEDSADDSKMPAIFRQEEENIILPGQEKKSGQLYPYADSCRWGFTPDIFAGVGSKRYISDNYYPAGDGYELTSYKSHYYFPIIEGLGTFGRKAESAIIDCLREMNSITNVPDEASLSARERDVRQNRKYFWPKDRRVKVGKDISESEALSLWQRGRKSKEDAVTRGLLELHWTNEDAIIDSVSRGQVGVSDFERLYDEYEFEKPTKRALEILREFKTVSSETISYLVNELIYQDETLFAQLFSEVMAVLEKKPELSGQLLMERIQTEEDKYLKALFTRALYELELGKIGMSEEGVNYLGKVFDLGRENDPSHFAHRATGDGKVAIFDEQQKAVGYFQLHDLDTPDKKVKAEFLQFTYETLFHPQPGETPEARAEREKILAEFKEKYFETYLTGFYEETGVRFNNLSFPEQGWFLWFAQNASEADKTRAKQFVKKYREPGFKTFLSLEQDRQAGEVILGLGENLDREVADKVFAKYNEMVGLTEVIGSYLQENFPQASQGEINKIVGNLLRKAKDLLIGAANEPQASESNILNKLKLVRSDLLLFASVFRTMASEEGADLETIKNVTLEKTSSGELSVEDRKKILGIAEANSGEREFGQKVVLPALHGGLEKPNNDFYLLKIKNELAAFFRLENSGRSFIFWFL